LRATEKKERKKKLDGVNAFNVEFLVRGKLEIQMIYLKSAFTTKSKPIVEIFVLNQHAKSKYT
jgi:hypothetical protein